MLKIKEMGKRTHHPLDKGGAWKEAQEIVTLLGGDPGQMTGCRYDCRSNNFSININHSPAITVNAEMSARWYGRQDAQDISAVCAPAPAKWTRRKPDHSDHWDMIAEAQGNNPRSENPSGLLNLFGAL